MFTILTEPIYLNAYDRFANKHIRNCINFLLKKRSITEILKLALLIARRENIKKTPIIGGPNEVIKNLIKGLEKSNISYNYNPENINNIHETLFVPTNRETLKTAIRLKEKKIVRRLVAGPNIAPLPFEIESLKKRISQIDVFLFASQWTVKRWLKYYPDFPVQTAVWPAGVDSDYWTPDKAEKKRQPEKVLIYSKRAPDDIFTECLSVCQKFGLDATTIRYGQFTHEQYLKALREADFSIYLSKVESQGIALFEAWSCDVPTLVWDKGSATYNKNKYSYDSSSAPYLSDATGIKFKDINEIPHSIEQMISRMDSFSPRKWILSNGTDIISAKALHKLLGDENSIQSGASAA